MEAEVKIFAEKEFEKLNNTALTIGKFDGFHKGHQTLLEEILKLKQEGFSSAIFSFKKAPKEVLDLKEADYILTATEKEAFLENRGIDYYIEYPCDEEVLKTDAKDFLKDVIVDKIGAKRIVCGTDFHFGKNRQGDVELLKKYQQEYGYQLIVLDKLQYENADISSTRIREAVKNGNIELANKLLGYTYTVIGRIIDGNKIGRTLKFPTANIIPDKEKLLPPMGVYCTQADISGKTYKGVTNVGTKPTINQENQVSIETYFLDYNGDLYGKTMEIRFYHYVRPEIKFESLELLKEQIKKDIDGCLEFFG